MELPPGFALHRRWFRSRPETMDTLMNASDWEQPVLTMFGKKVKAPRLATSMGISYTYSGKTHEAKPWHPHAEYIRALLEADFKSRYNGAVFNSCLLNLYRDGADTVGWHSDDEKELGLYPVIASLSLGATRRFSIKSKDGAVDERWDVDLEDGDLVIMSHRSQQDFKHSVPRQKHVDKPRLNLTFRYIRPSVVR